MGKNRKPRNVVQNQIQNALGTGNYNQNILKECLVTDKFANRLSKNLFEKSVGEDKLKSPLQSYSEEKSLFNEANSASFSGSKTDETVEDLSKPFQSTEEPAFKDSTQPSTDQIYASKNSIERSIVSEEELLNDSILINGSDTNSVCEESVECPPGIKEVLHHGLSAELQVFKNADCSENPNKNDPREFVNLVEDNLSKLKINELSFQSKRVSMCVSQNVFDESTHCDQINDVPNQVVNKVDGECNESNLLNEDLGNYQNVTSDIKNVENNDSVTNSQSGTEGITLDAKPKSTAQKKKERKAKAKQRAESSDSIEKEISKSECEVKSVCNEEDKKLKNMNEADKKGKKRPSKKQLAMIHEALKKAKEEEEKQRKEEEARQKMAEEAERKRLEKLKAEQDRKEMKKLKEKKRKEKAKAEGRLLSKSQKQSRARMEATLDALRQQGIDVPQICKERTASFSGPRLGSCKNFQRKRMDSCRSTNSSDSAIVISERQKYESFSSQESSGKDSLSDFPGSLDLAEDSSFAPESDKDIYSCSEESDDNCILNKENRKDSENSSSLKKSTLMLPSTDSELVAEKENTIKLRSPVVCVLGHVDTGKTKILDHIRKTHVQDSEAGGITQQIGATMIPSYALKEKCKMVNSFSSCDLKIPGLLVIDTPGHESFGNLRSRGSSVCDIAILVVDIMHGLEPQTIESINLLKNGKTPFIVALNKVDRIYGWKSSKNEDIETTLKNQSSTTQMEFKKLCQRVVLEFANQCLNVALFYENIDPRSFVSMVPASAVTGDGMGNIMSLIAQLTQSVLPKRLTYSEELQATVLEVKAIPGLGTTIDVILVNGRLREGDTIVLAGQDGPIVTQIRSLLMPQPLKELRVKNPYIEHKVVEGAQGVKISGKDLEKSVAGLPLFVAHNPAMIDSLKNELNFLLQDAVNFIRTSERGVYVLASTLGSLEALVEFLSSSGIPYFSVKIGPVVKKDVMKASIMLEHDVMYAAILAFDVKVERDAQELADNLGVKIFQADIIYHLLDVYDKYREDLSLKRKQLAVFPCKLKIDPDSIISVKDPLVLGVQVEAGTLRENTPLCIIVHKEAVDIGIISSIEVGNNKVSSAKKGDEARITINAKPGDSPKTYGKHFSHEDILISRITRQSIDVCKELFRSELQSGDWHLMVELKKLLHIV